MLCLGLSDQRASSLPIFNLKPSALITQHLLSLTNVNVFQYVRSFLFKHLPRCAYSPGLFPKLDYANVKLINNSARGSGPVVCAADDLELSLHGDQIEFFNSFISQPVVQQQQQYVDHNPGYDHLSPSTSISYQHHPSVSTNYDLDFTFDQIYDYSIVKQQQHPYESHSHFSLNMIGLNTTDYFDDFNKNDINNFKNDNVNFNNFNLTKNDLVHPGSYGSNSSESQVSPLDDDFLKITSNEATTTHTDITNITRKPKRKKSPSVDEFFSDLILRNQSDVQYVPQRTTSTHQLPQHNHQHHHQHQHHQHNQHNHQLPEQQRKKIKLEPSDDFAPNPNVYPLPPSLPASPNDVKLEPLPSLQSPLDTKSQPQLDNPAKYQCSHCHARFKVRSYLTRHLKKHNSWKAFVCPFFQHPSSTAPTGTKCHPTGGFSRRDTFKTHLKALHFIYPPGTKSNERNAIGGRCAGCFTYFDNNLLWLEQHIEAGKCLGTVEKKRSRS